MSMVENAGNWNELVREQNVAKTVLFLDRLRLFHPELEVPGYAPKAVQVIEPEPKPESSVAPLASPPIVTNAPINVRALGSVHPVNALLRSASQEFGFTSEELLSRRHHAHLARARHIVMFLGMECTSLSLPEMGRRMGGRDHTTILSGVRKMRRLLAGGDTQLAAQIEAVRTRAFPAAVEEPIWS